MKTDEDVFLVVSYESFVSYRYLSVNDDLLSESDLHWIGLQLGFFSCADEGRFGRLWQKQKKKNHQNMKHCLVPQDNTEANKQTEAFQCFSAQNRICLMNVTNEENEER